jgi:30S ribosomal protein S31
MGKGDKKTRRGKIVRGSFGVRRRRKGKTIAQIIRQKEKETPAEKLVEVIKKEKTEKIDKAEEKPAPKKPAAKKTTVKKAETETKAEKKPAKKPAAKSTKKPAEKKE